MKQKYFEKKVLNQEEIDEFWEGITSGKRTKGPLPVPIDREPTKNFVTRISKWVMTNNSVKSIQYNENLSECVVIYIYE